MEHENTVENVARMMDGLRFASSGTFTLYAINHQLQLSNKKDLPPYCCVIEKFTSQDINEGLRPEHWNNLQGKILTLIHKGVLR